MSRILFWLALVALVVFAIRSKLRGLQRRGEQMRRQQQAGAAQGGEPLRQARQRDLDNAETMLCCAHCGVYYPASENVPAAGRDYCSPAHAQLAG